MLGSESHCTVKIVSLTKFLSPEQGLSLLPNLVIFQISCGERPNEKRCHIGELMAIFIILEVLSNEGGLYTYKTII